MTVRETLIEKAYAKYELKKRAARIDFWQYCLFHDYKFFTERPFLEIVADAFMRVRESYKKGESRSLAVSMPPRAGKSYITTLFITFMIGNFPEESVMRNCCSDQLYQKLSYDTRDIIRSAKFKELFPDVCLKGDKQNVKGWSVEQARQVTYFGGGVGGTVIGFGASLLDITDDLYKSIEDARSETINEKHGVGSREHTIQDAKKCVSHRYRNTMVQSGCFRTTRRKRSIQRNNTNSCSK